MRTNHPHRDFAPEAQWKGQPCRLFGAMICAASIAVWAGPVGAQYHTYDQIGPELLAAETNYPSICKRYDLGLSVQGRHLWALRISDNMPLEEDEPEFKYISTMHGNEPVGTEMCMYLIDDLTTNYGTDPELTHLVNELDIWILPMMNPDGNVAVSRYNANGVDLNRNFPDPHVMPFNTTAGREVETGIIMNWSSSQSFTCSANFHTGALVANYPFDTNENLSSTYTATPYDDLFIWMCEEYSRSNTPMWNSSTFYHGITNGADWYHVEGSMQDWNYHYVGCNEITVELYGVTKWPSSSMLPQFWNENRQSMLDYMATSLIGVRGVVSDAITSDPLAATITVTGRDHEVYTDPDIGDYHRMVLPGSYELTFAATGYDSVTVSGVVVSSGDATRLDVSLWPIRMIYPNGGERLPPGVETTVTWVGNPSAQFQVQYSPNVDDTTEVLHDGFETGSLDAPYSTGGDAAWTVVTGQTHDGSYAARSGAIGNYDTTWLTRTVEGEELSFWYQVSSEARFDHFVFYIDGERKWRDSGTGGGWKQYSTPLSPGPHTLEWEYSKNSWGSDGSDAVWIDDVQVINDNTTWFDVTALTPIGATSTSWTPPSEGGSYKVRVRSFDGVDTYGPWDESDATFAVVDQVIPTVSEWGLVVMALVMCAAATLVLDRRRHVGAYSGSTTAGCRAGLGGRRSMTVTKSTLALLLLAWGGSVCLADDRVVAIHTAAAAGDTARIDALLRETPDLVHARDGSRRVPLHPAAGNLHEAAAESLLNAGADVNAKDRDGLTALHIAVRAGADSEAANTRRKALVSLLIRRGADVKAAEGQGKTPLHLAAMKSRTELLDVLHAAGADVRATDRLGRTPLHEAAMYNHLAVIDWLVSKKADLDAKDHEGNTPLHVAALRYRKEATGRLIKHGAEVNSKNKQLATPLHVASAAGPEVKEVDRLLTAVADVLIKHGAEINAMDQVGHTPLQNAVERNHRALAEFLRERGAEQ